MAHDFLLPSVTTQVGKVSPAGTPECEGFHDASPLFNKFLKTPRQRRTFN